MSWQPWCAKSCCNLVASNWITARRSFHQIWIASKESLVKWAPDLHLLEYPISHWPLSKLWGVCIKIYGDYWLLLCWPVPTVQYLFYAFLRNITSSHDNIVRIKAISCLSRNGNIILLNLFMIWSFFSEILMKDNQQLISSSSVSVRCGVSFLS